MVQQGDNILFITLYSTKDCVACDKLHSLLVEVIKENNYNVNLQLDNVSDRAPKLVLFNPNKDKVKTSYGLLCKVAIKELINHML